MSRFTAEVYQNEYLPTDGSEVNAIVTIASTGGGAPQPAVRCRRDRDRRHVGLDGRPEDQDQGGPRGDRGRHRLHPRRRRRSRSSRERTAPSSCIQAPRQGLVAATAETREQAKRAVSSLKAGGGTAIGVWLTLAGELFTSRARRRPPRDPAHRRRERARDRRGARQAHSRRCEGRFQCDCRGVGTDWVVDELRRVATRLLGTVDIIADPADMAGDFRAMMETAMGKATGNVTLRVWTPQDAVVAFVRQVAPTIEELTDRAVRVDARTVDYPTGAWGEESRDYHVCIKVPPRAVGDEMLAGRVSLRRGRRGSRQA